MERRVHGVWPAGGEALPVDPAQHTLAGKAAVGKLSRQRAIAEYVTACHARSDGCGIGRQGNLPWCGNRIAGDGVAALGGDDDGIGKRILA